MFSSLLNMCSAPSGGIADARSAIVNAAVELIGCDGAAGTTVRAVASAAGVSAPLVIHHFGSKQGLVAACDDHVREVVSRAVEALIASPSEVGVQALLATADVGPALAYAARSVQSGGDVGRWWFDEMVRTSTDLYASMVDAGSARRLDDPEMGVLLLTAMELGLLLMRPLVERHLGADLTDPALLERWAHAELDLLTHGLIVEPGGSGR
jgi:AcrR family transcriptional regulator